MSMIEKVAKAIALRDTTDEFAMARAAIEAMREPTEAMIEFGFNQTGDGRENVKAAWHSMIDAALR